MNATTSPAPVAAEDTQTPVDDQATAPATTNEPTETPAGETPLEDVTDWSELERRLAAVDAPEPEAPEATQEEPAEPATEETPEATEADDDEPQDPDQATTGHAKRYRLPAKTPQRAKYYALLRQFPDANPADLAIEAGYEPTAKEAPKPEQAAPQPETNPLQPLKDEVAALEKQIAEAEEGYNPTGVLNAKLTRKLQELSDATREQKEEKAARLTYDADESVAKQAAFQRHPDTAKADTEQYRMVKMAVAIRERENPTFFSDPEWPLALLSELERDFPKSFPKKGIAPVVPAARPAAQPAKTPPAARPVGQTVPGTAGGPKKLTAAEVDRQIDSMSFEELTALSNAVGTKNRHAA